MSAESGYGKISTSGLTFAYDVGDTKNSFKGKPTTNYVTNAGTMANFGNYSCGTPVTFTTEFGTTGYRMSNLGSWNGVVMGGISLPSNGVYTFSAYIRYIGGSPNNNGGTVYTSGFGVGSDTASYHNKSIVGEWFRLTNTQTCTTAGGTFYLISFGGTYCDDYSSWEVTMPQIEAGSFATPWVDGSRSTTQGLIDITGNRSLELINSPFSGNNFVLDGTNQTITLSPTMNLYSMTNSTLSAFIYINTLSHPDNSHSVFGGVSTEGYHGYHEIRDNGSGYKMCMWTSANGWKYSNTSIQQGEWYHVVWKWEGTKLTFYLNGEYDGENTFTTFSPYGLGFNQIGSFLTSERFFDGIIYSAHVYNRALSNSEILGIYSHYNKRTSLSGINPIKDGSTSALAAPSATYLKNLGISKDGNYWIQPEGQTAFQVPVKFHLNKAMVCVMKGGNGSGYVPDSSYWENTTLDNSSDFTLTNGVSSKYQSYNVVPFTEFYWTMGELNYQSTFSLASEVSSMYTAQTRSWNNSANRSTPHFGNSIDYRSLVGADRRYTSALGTEIYLMGMDLKHEGHYGGGGGSSGGRIRVGSILDESTGNTAGEAYGNAGSAFGIGVNGGNPLKTGVCGYAGWTEPSIIGGTDNWSLWVVF